MNLKAVKAGVLEIESHGWTHMQPDLESPPGPWWTADLEGEASSDGWYTEFADDRRGIESPAIVQLFHMRRSLEYLQEDFGQRALELRPGGSGWSKSQFNNTGRLAAQAGFGLFHAEPDFYYYLDRDLVLDMTGIAPQVGTTSYDRLTELHPERWPAHPDGPVDPPHRRAFARFFAAWAQRDGDTMARLMYSMSSANPDNAAAFERFRSAIIEFVGRFNFDKHYCAYFESHPSSWVLRFSDPFRQQLEGVKYLDVSVDGKAPTQIKAAEFLHETVTLDLPAGLGSHVWKLQAVR